MDLRSLGIDLQHKRLVLTLRDAAGDSAHTLDGAAVQRVLTVAVPLLEALEQRYGPLQKLSLNPTAGTLHLGTHKGTEVLEGEPYQALLPLLREPARLSVREARPRKVDPDGLHGDAEIWEHKYTTRSDGWELMRPPPPLLRWIDLHPPLVGALVLVPGCGRGHEARLLAARGAQVVAIDVAPSAIAECQRLAEEQGLADRIAVKQLDLFRLPPEHQGRYDLILEHCCFCAVDPSRREEYVAAVFAALRPGGRLVGLFYCHDYPGGPPYGASRAEVEERFSARFHIRHGEVPTDSIVVRAGQELLLDMERKNAL